jgi:hypothetical protein
LEEIALANESVRVTDAEIDKTREDGFFLEPIRNEHPYIHEHTFTTMDERTYAIPMSPMSTSEPADRELKIDKIAACVCVHENVALH